MELFAADPTANLLPCDGTVRYLGRMMSVERSDRYFRTLFEAIPWKSDEVVIFGKRMITARKVAWYGDSPFSYTYSRTTKQALPWTTELRELKQMVEEKSGAHFNSCLLNLYHHGGEGMAWHSDDENELVENAAIASVSLGAERKFCFKHKRAQETVFVMLEHGSLLLMEGATQTHWLHRLPPMKKVTAARINLTFRSLKPQV